MNAQTAHTPTPWRINSVSTTDHYSAAIVQEAPPFLCVAELNHGDVETDPKQTNANAAFICEAVNAHAQLVERNEKLNSLLSQMLDAAENADETGYVADLGFIDLDKLHAEVRAALNPPPTK